ncbi:MAG: hypothetical protein ACKOCB_02245 [Planctomycetia bacterium]
MSDPTAPSPPAAPAATGRRRLLLLALFLASGAVGLAYEVAWARLLARVVGSTPAGHSLVLGIFVGALGLGARWAGARAGRSARPLLAYAGLEAGAAIWAALAMAWLAVLEPLALASCAGAAEPLRWLVRAGVVLVVVAPAAFLLGGTLPFMVQAWPRAQGRGEGAVAWLYGTNTLGAVLGAWGSGFVLLQAVGIPGTLQASAAVGALVALAAALAGRRHADPGGRTAPGPARDAVPGAASRGALLTAMACGAVGLSFEVVGFRVLTFFVEGFTASFAAMLGTFILGLGAGSLLLGGWASRCARPARALALLLAGFAAWSLLAVAVLVPRMEGLLLAARGWAYAGASAPGDLVRGHALLAWLGSALLFLVPALLLGPTFPLCVRLVRAAGASEPQAVGSTYLANSVGSLVGPLVATFVAVPWLGVLPSLLLPVVLALALLVGQGSRLRRALAALLALGAVGLLATPPAQAWLGDARLVAASHVLARKPERRLLDARSDALTTASVVELPDGERILYTDDFAAAATGPAYRYMRLLGHLPALLAARQEHALVICFGTGTSAGAVAQHPGVRRLEVAEVSRAVLAQAPWFEEVHGGVLRDARTTLHVADGREVLALHAGDLDLITLEPLMPYSPAGLPFYTRDFYALARERLREGGVLCQWVPVHAMRVGLYEALLRAFLEVFPEGSIWFFEQSTALVGRKGTQAPSREELARRFEAARAHLSGAGFADLSSLEAACVAEGRLLRALPGAEPGLSGRRVSDRDPWPEFHATPRGVSTSYLPDTLAFLLRLAQARQAGATPPFGAGAGAEDWPRRAQGGLLALEGRGLEALAQHLVPQGTSPERVTLLGRAAERYARALDRLPGDQALVWRRARTAREAAEASVRSRLSEAGVEASAGRLEAARRLRVEALREASSAEALADGVSGWSRRGPAAGTHALALLALGRCARALAVLAQAERDLPAGPERAELGSLRVRMEAHARDEGGAPWPSWLGPLPACEPPGVGVLAQPLAAWDGARRAAPAVVAEVERLARALLARADAEGLRMELAAALDGMEAGEGAAAAVLRASLQARLRAGHPALPALALQPGTAQALALVEAGRLRLLRTLPMERLEALAGAPEAALRAALLEAVGADGDERLAPLAIARLDDPQRSVRSAAAAALLQFDAQQMADYDPDQPGTWGRVMRRLRR